MAIKPLGDRIAVKQVDSKDTTAAGIVLPDSAKEKPTEGKVIAVGPGKTLDDGTVQPLEVKNGDRILYGKYAATEVTIDGDELLILREDDILAIVK